MKKTKNDVSPRKKPLQERAKFTVDAILKASTQLLEKNGESVSTNHIAEKAGVSIGSLYQYFPNKDAILGALLEQYSNSHFKIIEKALERSQKEDVNLEATIRTIIHSLIESHKKNSKLSRIFLTTLFRPERLKILQRMDDKMISKIKEYIEPFRDEVRSENFELALFIIIQMMKATPMAINYHDQYKLDDPIIEDELVRVVLKTLKN